MSRRNLVRPRIYIASKAHHGPRWREYRDRGVPIISTWIDEAEPGATACFTDLWDRCIREACTCDVLICYGEPGETLKGALVEIGAALASGRRVILVGSIPGTFHHHRLVERAESIEGAFARVAGHPDGHEQAA